MTFHVDTVTTRPGNVLAHQLSETAPVIRSALQRLQGRPVLIKTADDVPAMNGRIVLVESGGGSALPSLTIEFVLRSLVFTMEVPLGRVFDLVASWTGTHYVFRLPPGNRLSVQRPT